jgi:hypothetical protein
MNLKLLAATLALAATFLPAQQNTGSISGSITDPNGASVPGASVKARHEPTGQIFEVPSSDAGLYVFNNLPTGPYTVTVEKVGFRRVNRSNIELRVAARQELDVVLEVGDVQQSIDITADAPQLETQPMRGTSVSPQMLSTLPIFSGGIRSAQAFVSYMPGVSSGTAELSIAGSGGRAAEVLIDGASLTIPESGGVVFNFPGAEMFGEFKLLTGSYDAEYGRFGGGVQIYVTKSGTNDLHGAAFLNMRRDIWNANSWANNSRGAVKNKERFNEIGGAIGGPIWIPKVYDGRNKTFWYFTYSKDQRPISILGTPVNTVPTVRMKNGDFGEVPQLIYDPATTAGNTRTPFPNNIIPSSRFSRIARNIIPDLPNPTRATTISNFDYVNLQVFDRYVYNLKFDHAITNRNRVAFLVTKEQQINDDNTQLPGPLGQGLLTYQRPDNWRINHDLILRPTVLLHSTYGYSRTRQFWDNHFQRGAASKYGFPGITGDSDATPRVGFRGADGLTAWGVQDGKVANGSQLNITYHFSQKLSWVSGKHEWKVGWELRRLQTTSNPLDLAGTNGQYFFNRAQTASPTNLAGTGNAFASLLLGAVDEANRVGLPVQLGNIRYGYHAFYLNDSWRVSPRLTLTLGVRYDLPINWHEKNGDYSMVDVSKPNPAAGGLPGAVIFAGNGAGRTGQKRFYPTDFSNLGPSGGFAYRVGSRGVIRGGFGIFYQTLGNGGCGCRIGFAVPISSVSDGVNQAFNWDSGLVAPPSFRSPFIDPSVGILSGDMDVMGNNFGKAPRIYNWSLGVQQEVKNFLIDISYAGNRGRGLNSTVELNQLPVSNLALGTLLQRPISSPEVVAAGYKKPYANFPDNQTLAQALRPFPQYFGVLDRNSGAGRTWYDSLQTKVERRFGRFQLMGSYVWSKSLGANHYRQIFSQHFNVGAQDAYNLNDMKALMPFDQPHIFNALWTLELPFGKGRKYMGNAGLVTNLLLGNWTVSGAQQYRSGAPIQVTAPNTLGNGVLFSRFKKANRGTGPIRTGIDRTTLDPNDPSARWFNPNAYTLPGQFELGTASTYATQFRQPPVFSENISLAKRFKFPIARDRTVDLFYQASAFNLLNRTNFGGVVSAIGNPNFGRTTGPQLSSRIVTMVLRLEF